MEPYHQPDTLEPSPKELMAAIDVMMLISNERMILKYTFNKFIPTTTTTTTATTKPTQHKDDDEESSV